MINVEPLVLEYHYVLNDYHRGLREIKGTI